MTPANTSSPWSVVVVDDDPDVFTITELVLRGFTILDRSVALQQCRSAWLAFESRPVAQSVKDRWRNERQPEIRDAIYADLEGTDLEVFLRY